MGPDRVAIACASAANATIRVVKSGSHWLHIRQSRHVTWLSPRFRPVRSQAWCDDACSPPLVRGVGSDGWEPRTAWGWADTRGFGLKKSCRMSHITPDRCATFGRPKRCEDATPRPNPRRFEITSLPNQHPEPAAAHGDALGIARIVIPYPQHRNRFSHHPW